MTIFCWIILSIIGILVITTPVICRKLYCEYWRENRIITESRFNTGFLLPCFKRIFFVLEQLSLIFSIRICIKKIGGLQFIKRQYFAADIYTVAWFIILSSLFWFFFDDCAIVYPCPFLAIIIYRLFDIFQFWTNEYIIGRIHSTSLVNISRTLILNIINYAEIIISFSLIAFIQRHLFKGVDCMTQAFYYSIRNAITIGSDVTPIGFWGYTIFALQVLFILLFLTVVISNIVGYKKGGD